MVCKRCSVSYSDYIGVHVSADSGAWFTDIDCDRSTHSRTPRQHKRNWNRRRFRGACFDFVLNHKGGDSMKPQSSTSEAHATGKLLPRLIKVQILIAVVATIFIIVLVFQISPLIKKKTE